MKSTELNQMNILELKTRLDENLDSLQNLRFQQSLQQLEDGTVISRTRKEIAQNAHVDPSKQLFPLT